MGQQVYLVEEGDPWDRVTVGVFENEVDAKAYVDRCIEEDKHKRRVNRRNLNIETLPFYANGVMPL